MEIAVPESEVVDRITILELKASRLRGPDQAHAAARLLLLVGRWEAKHGVLSAMGQVEGLREVNAALWDVESKLREREAGGLFDAGFIALARSVYRLNDRRGALKRSIDEELGSAWREVKDYGPGPDPS